MNLDTSVQGPALVRAMALFQESRATIHRRADRFFANLMVVQWLAGITAALWISPKTWAGASSQTHWHVWAAIFLGGAITAFPAFMAWKHDGRVLTRHVIAVGQMLTSALLIHLTGGRIETHFHVFGSLAFLAFYRDWRVLVTATVVVAVDHFVRGMYWPQSVYGVLTVSSWRWFEHAGWVLFEDTFLIISIRQSLSEMFEVATRRAKLETLNLEIERQVAERTAELTAAHQELQASEQRFRTLSDSAPIGIFLTDAAGSCLYTNPHWHRIAGLSLKASLGDGWKQALHPEDADDVLAARNSGNAEGCELDREFRYRRPDSEVRWVHARATAIHSEAGNIIGRVGTVEDITERRRVEVALRAAEEKYRSIFENAVEGIFQTTPDGRYLVANPTLARMYGYESVAALQAGINDIGTALYVDPLRRAEFRKEIEQLGKVCRFESQVRRQDGSVIWISEHARAVRDAHGKLLCFEGTVEDITERKRNEAELEKVHKELMEASRVAGMAEVATGVLHNVGNVLNSVNVSANVVADQVKKSKLSHLARVVDLLRQHKTDMAAFLTADPHGRNLPEFLSELGERLGAERATVLQEVEQLRKNVEHIKDIVAMQQSYAKVSGMTETIQVTDLVEDAMRINSGALVRHDVRLIREFADHLPEVTVDRHKVLQILVNLIRNAKYACEESGKQNKQIKLSVAQNGDGRIKIQVNDNGVGIPKENLTRIFNHGFTTRKEGHGFGLHSGALAVKEMGGVLSVHSDGPGHGATFTVELPATPSKP